MAGADRGVDQPAAVLFRPARAGETLMPLWRRAFAVFTVLGSALALAGMLVERSLPAATFAPFGGWQLDVLAVTFGDVLVVLLALSVIALVRRYRGLRGQTRHRRAVVVAAFLPGLFLGGLIGNPMAAAISWASSHTADARRASAQAHQILADYRAGPPAPATGKPAAPSAVSGRLLHPSDLGLGWYDGQHPNPSVAAVSVLAAKLGASEAVQAKLYQEHWTGSAWLPQHIAVETVLRFRTAAGVQRYLRAAWERPATVCNGCTQQPATAVRVGGVTVFERGMGGSSALRSADFAVGPDLFSFSIDVMANGTPGPRDFAALLARVVARATAAG